jgi:hypothetical protein
MAQTVRGENHVLSLTWKTCMNKSADREEIASEMSFASMTSNKCFLCHVFTLHVKEGAHPSFIIFSFSLLIAVEVEAHVISTLEKKRLWHRQVR